MGIFDRTSVVHGDEGRRDGHYRVKDTLFEMVVRGDGTEQKLDPNAPIALQAQNPPELGDVRVGSASEEAAGIPAIWNTMLYGIGDMGVMDIAGIHTRKGDANPNFTCTGLRVVHLADDQHILRCTLFLVPSGFHYLLPTAPRNDSA